MRHCIRFFCAALVLSLGVGTGGIVPAAHGQAASTPTVPSENHVHTYARPGHATQTVYVWGAVSQPGIWKIEPNTDLVELFSVVHPSGYGVETTDTRKKVVLRIRRSAGGQTRVAHEMDLDELMDMRPSRRPTLRGGDVLEVRTVEKQKFDFERFGSILGTLSSLVLLGLRIFDR